MKFVEKEFSIISIGEDKYLLNLRNVYVTINNTRYNGLTIIYRLLTYDELRVIDRLLPDEKDNRINSSAVSAETEEDIFRKCVYHIFGIDNHEEIDLDDIEAGIVSTVAGLILKTAYSHIQAIGQHIDNYSASITIFDQIKLIICRNYHISYSEVCKLSIDQLLKQYAVVATTYPSEAIRSQQPEAPSQQDD
jgi:hypothetical protein